MNLSKKVTEALRASPTLRNYLCISSSTVNVMDAITTAVTVAAPITHPKGNKRYYDLVLRVVNDDLLDITPIKDSHCQNCAGLRGFLQYDDFGDRLVKIPCSDCS